MAEQLKQIEVKKIGKYNHFILGSTTLGQLKSEGIISNSYNVNKKLLIIQEKENLNSFKFHQLKKITELYSGKEINSFTYEFNQLEIEGERNIKELLNNFGIKYRITRIANNKPDSLITLGKKVIAYIEWKDKLKSEFLNPTYIGQKTCVAKELANLLILTDSEKTLWINTYNGQDILNEKNSKINLQFNNFLIESEPIKLENILDKINSSITKTNNNLSVERTVLDPSDLADTLWQKIYSATGKDPQKCLYNVVELVLFKYLSDINILTTDCNFEKVYELSKTDDREALRYYADNSRKKLREKFPNSKFDDTTIINGVIFINEKNEPSLDQSLLFKLCLRDIKDYEKKNGKLDNISKNFKTLFKKNGSILYSAKNNSNNDKYVWSC
jgi:type I restriction enzyme M protein